MKKKNKSQVFYVRFNFIKSMKMLSEILLDKSPFFP